MSPSPQIYHAIAGSFEAIHLLLFGPQQHDAHVRRYRQWLWLELSRLRDDAGLRAVTAHVEQWRAERRRRHVH